MPCCPQPRLCCLQLPPICLPPPPPLSCCTISFKVPTIPICMRSCPVCPCRRRVHRSHRLKRSALGGFCTQCSQSGEPWRAHRQKRHAPRAGSCSSPAPVFPPQTGCNQCGASHLRSTRVKRMGCLPCLGRKKREVDAAHEKHTRVKRMGCLPCLGRKKRSVPNNGNCQKCSNMGQLFQRYKRSLGCSPCNGRKKRQVPTTQSCACQSARQKRQAQVQPKIVRKVRLERSCDASCCDYSSCPDERLAAFSIFM
ncbi:unnamed protein product [Caenorhabditis auriculariae]|uniref:Uncharacterized protein n=1 Tax=Caenorhabditis auriculariae TaxID=2777116 RepID=A0A8S1HU08_9PELO|nr:unnamed protein product [Caenorhabditis auriculariae]